ncbi:MAG: hypothetical protein CVT70_02635 [Alphaproteobacteria bacterium HGW-Alphaproteobacteria-1]|jgi:hypothetical protein|nr:MAG: hypothetical protein CVT70_02635 [Alphaproteobacteria bacterium HGW-Alphaproteobacteria-1]
MTRSLIAATLALGLAVPAAADEIADTLQSALDAYAEGDAAYALEELDYARQLLLQLKTEALAQFLPEAPAGWTREINTEMNAGLAMMGGGTGTEATYRGEGKSITLQFMADNPMVGALGGMIGNAALYGGKVERVGREKFMVQDREVTGLVDNRILVKASGAEPEALLALVGTIDMRALKEFGK